MKKENRDYLTGLYSRQELNQIYNNIPSNTPFHFMFMDIDNFKNVNDVYGHNEGDQLLKSTAGILKSCAPISRTLPLIFLQVSAFYTMKLLTPHWMIFC